MISSHQDYDRFCRDFRWNIPDYYNIGVDVADKWAARQPDRPAILEVAKNGTATTLNFGDLSTRSNRLANALHKRGITSGDRVAVLLPQCWQTIVSHIAIYKLGAIALPLALLFGADALDYRLRDAGVKALITNAQGYAKIRNIADAISEITLIINCDGADGTALDFDALLRESSPDFLPRLTKSDDPALIIYTSGTTGPPKGALHGHRVLPGHIPGAEFAHPRLRQSDSLMWTPADWAWAGGLLNALLPALHFGIPVVAWHVEKFDPEAAFHLMSRLAVRNAFVPPTALRMMRMMKNPRSRYELQLRSIMAAGETLGSQTSLWAQEALGLTVNEAYGQTECNLVLGSCAELGVTRAGTIGKPTPGHHSNIIRMDGTVCDDDEPGQIAIRAPDPVMFLGYWGKPDATAEKFIGDWMISGDQGVRDSAGYIRFIGRDDDIITSSGFRIGPGEVEDCLLRHPGVVHAAVTGKPDPLRTEIVKAFIVLRPGYEATEAMISDLQNFVRQHLAAHEYPREISFVQSLPQTATGKIIRRLLRDQA